MGISVDDDDQEKREFLPGTEKSFFTLSRAMALDALYLNQVFLREPPKQNKNKQEEDLHVEPVLMINTLLNLSSKGVSRSLSGALVIV